MFFWAFRDFMLSSCCLIFRPRDCRSSWSLYRNTGKYHLDWSVRSKICSHPCIWLRTKSIETEQVKIIAPNSLDVDECLTCMTLQQNHDPFQIQTLELLINASACKTPPLSTPLFALAGPSFWSTTTNANESWPGNAVALTESWKEVDIIS